MPLPRKYREKYGETPFKPLYPSSPPPPPAYTKLDWLKQKIKEQIIEPFGTQAAQTIGQLKQRAPVMGKGLVGLGETALNLAGIPGAMAGSAIAGLGGMGTILRGKGLGAGAQTVKEIEEKLIPHLQYQPRTEAGQQIAQPIGKVFETVFKKPGEKVGELLEKIPGVRAKGIVPAIGATAIELLTYSLFPKVTGKLRGKAALINEAKSLGKNFVTVAKMNIEEAKAFHKVTKEDVEMSRRKELNIPENVILNPQKIIKIEDAEPLVNWGKDKIEKNMIIKRDIKNQIQKSPELGLEKPPKEALETHKNLLKVYDNANTELTILGTLINKAFLKDLDPFDTKAVYTFLNEKHRQIVKVKTNKEAWTKQKALLEQYQKTGILPEELQRFVKSAFREEGSPIAASPFQKTEGIAPLERTGVMFPWEKPATPPKPMSKGFDILSTKAGGIKQEKMWTPEGLEKYEKERLSEITSVGARKIHPEVKEGEGAVIKPSPPEEWNFPNPIVDIIYKDFGKIERIPQEHELLVADILQRKGQIPPVEHQGLYNQYFANKIAKRLRQFADNILDNPRIPRKLKDIFVADEQQNLKKMYAQLRKAESSSQGLISEHINRIAQMLDVKGDEALAKQVREAIIDTTKMKELPTTKLQIGAGIARKTFEMLGINLMKAGLLKDPAILSHFNEYFPQIYRYWEARKMLSPDAAKSIQNWNTLNATERLMHRNITIENAEKILTEFKQDQGQFRFGLKGLETESIANLDNALQRQFPAYRYIPLEQRVIIVNKLKSGAPIKEIAKDVVDSIKKNLQEVSPAFAFLKGGIQESALLFRQRTLNAMLKNPEYVKTSLEGLPESIANNYFLVPDVLKWGPLRNKYLHKSFYEDMEGSALMNPVRFQQFLDTLFSAFKWSKTAGQPIGTMPRNVLFNIFIMTPLRTHTGFNPYKIGKLMWNGIRAIRDVDSDLYREARQMNVLRSDFINADLKRTGMDEIDQLLKTMTEKDFNNNMGIFTKIVSKIPNFKPIKALSKLYSLSDEIFRMGDYKYLREKAGLSAQQAAQEVMSTYGDYGKYATAGIVQTLGEFPFYQPFIKFPFSVVPRLLGGAVLRHPFRVAILPTTYLLLRQYFMQRAGVTDEEYQEWKDHLPPYKKPFSIMMIPYAKGEKKGEIKAFDITNLIPYIGKGTEVSYKGIRGLVSLLGGPFNETSMDVGTGTIGYIGKEMYNVPPGGIFSKDFVIDEFPKILDYLQKQWTPNITPEIPHVTKGGYVWEKAKGVITGQPDWRGNVYTPMDLLLYSLGIKPTYINMPEDIKAGRSYYQNKAKDIFNQSIKEFLLNKRIPLKTGIEKAKDRLQQIKKSKELSPYYGANLIKLSIIIKMLENQEKQGLDRNESIQQYWNIRGNAIQDLIREKAGQNFPPEAIERLEEPAPYR